MERRHKLLVALIQVITNFFRQLSELLRHLLRELLERELEGLDVLPARVGGELVARILRRFFGVTFEFIDVMSFGLFDVFYKLIGVFNGITLQTFLEFVKVMVDFLESILFYSLDIWSVADFVIYHLCQFLFDTLGGLCYPVTESLEMLRDIVRYGSEALCYVADENACRFTFNCLDGRRERAGFVAGVVRQGPFDVDVFSSWRILLEHSGESGGLEGCEFSVNFVLKFFY
ncbi:ABC transporter, putative [Babesia ovata]|nr:ABC transporter, putative [Babesia ovata]GBE63021.1 ABC transporter, putative [Babesia ovata]